MKLTGNLLIGANDVPATEGTMKALNPATHQLIEPDFALGGVAQVHRAATLADEAFDSYSHTSLARARGLPRKHRRQSRSRPPGACGTGRAGNGSARSAT